MTRRSILLVPTSLCPNIWDMPSKTRLKRARLHSFNPHGFLVLPSGSVQGDGTLLCSGCLSPSSPPSTGSSWALRCSANLARAKCRISTPALHTLRKPFRTARTSTTSKVHAPARTQRPPHSTRTTMHLTTGSPTDGVSRRRRRTSAPCARTWCPRSGYGLGGERAVWDWGVSVSRRKHGASTLLRVRVRGDVVAVLGRAYPKDGAKPIAARARCTETTR
ncbi:hypothetical protein B0H11DRAFT_1966819 [Mycena galericulata]|nr:hypothetical protein B0H11DRAFT_1966819 [Mycena galericulata]